MRARTSDAIAELWTPRLRWPPDEVDETAALLEWMAADNFTFLGYRDYDLVREGDVPLLRSVPGTGLGILRDSGLATGFAELRRPLAGCATQGPRADAADADQGQLARDRAPAGVPRLHRREATRPGRRADRGSAGSSACSGCRRTPSASRPSPVVRRKVAAVMERAGFPKGSHDAKDLMQILETYPRDELFQISVDDLFEIAMGILGLQERRRVRLFIRRDDYGRFCSCLVYLPRERYTTQVRLRMQRILLDALGGTVDRLLHALFRVGSRARALRRAHRLGRGIRHRPAGAREAHRRGDPVVGGRAHRRRARGARRGAGRRGPAALRRRVPGGVQGGLSRARPRSPTSAASPRSRRRTTWTSPSTSPRARRPAYAASRSSGSDRRCRSRRSCRACRTWASR